jgi:hypothetical protein
VHGAAKFQGNAEDRRPVDIEDGALGLAEDDQEIEAVERTPLIAHVFCGFGLILFIVVLARVVAAVWPQL